LIESGDPLPSSLPVSVSTEADVDAVATDVVMDAKVAGHEAVVVRTWFARAHGCASAEPQIENTGTGISAITVDT